MKYRLELFMEIIRLQNFKSSSVLKLIFEVRLILTVDTNNLNYNLYYTIKLIFEELIVINPKIDEYRIEIANKVTYPVLVRPSYVLGGQSMRIVINDDELETQVLSILKHIPDNKILVDQFLERASEAEIDAICDGEDVHIMGIMEHVEPAGIHSGDSSAVLPPFSLGDLQKLMMEKYTREIALSLGVKGLINIQFAIKEDKVYIHGSTANRMLLSILESEKTSITVTHLDGLVLARSGLHHSVNYRSATLFGSLKKVEKDEDKTQVLEWIVNQMVPNHWDTLRPMYKKELDRTIVVEFTIETASAKIRDVGVNDEPEDYELPIWAGVVPIKQVAEYPIADEGKPKEMEIPKHILDYYNLHK